MPETINSALVDEKNELHNTDPWIWLFEVDINDSQKLCLAGHDANVEYGGETYYRYPVAVEVQRKDGDGSIGDVSVTVSNVAREVSAYLENDELIDERVTIRLVNKADLTQTIHEQTYRILDAVVTLDGCVFRCGQYSVFSAPFPAARYNRTRCRWTYGGRGCLYDTTQANSISGTNPNFDPTTCDLTLDGENGCRVHGLNEAANGLKVRHPAQFGAFPGIPKGPSRL